MSSRIRISFADPQFPADAPLGGVPCPRVDPELRIREPEGADLEPSRVRYALPLDFGEGRGRSATAVIDAGRP